MVESLLNQVLCKLLEGLILSFRCALEVLLWVEEWIWKSSQRLKRSKLDSKRFNIARFLVARSFILPFGSTYFWLNLGFGSTLRRSYLVEFGHW